MLLPHTDALAGYLSPELDTAAITNIINRAALFRAGIGSDNQVISSFRRALDSCQRVLGQDHQDTMTCWNNLAFAYQSAGQLDLAIPLYEENLEDRVRILGPGHPDVLISRNNLAYAYQLAGDLTRALPLYEQNLEDRIRILGPDHPQTLTSRNNLAHAYWLAGDPASATLFKRNADEANRILSHGDPITQSAQRSLMLVR
jgi:tetratricopeptide (TPR) repeat protein